ncbi:MAG: ATP-binding protein [Myxococcales bacterium]|nr:ATP-binding protein [Myxococcales bacterium]
MWSRLASDRLLALLRKFPAVVVIGARQVGKTTLVRRALPDLPYCDLEEPSLRALVSEDPTYQIAEREQRGLILDEVQMVPEVFAALRGIIDADRHRRGRFVLLGSVQPALIRGVSESLAGRIGVLELDPLVAAEVATGRRRRPWSRLWLHGGFPDAVDGDFREWWEAYLRTYIERDLPHLGVGADPLLLRRLLTMLAHQQGGLFNASQIAGSLGVSYHTVQRYVDVLEKTFLVRRLAPFFRNLGKRLVKAPKVYLRDTGLLHHLLGIASLAALDSHPIRGASFETFVIEDLLRRERLRHPTTRATFFRTATGLEADLVLERDAASFAVEVKAGSGRDPGAAVKLVRCLDDIGARRGFVLAHQAGVEPLVARVERRGFADSLTWLPGD